MGLGKFLVSCHRALSLLGLAFGASQLLFVVSCTSKLPEVPKETAVSQPVLTHQAAIARAAQVSNVSYIQEFFLDKARTTFSGKGDIAFDWKGGQPVKVDFFQG